MAIVSGMTWGMTWRWLVGHQLLCRYSVQRRNGHRSNCSPGQFGGNRRRRWNQEHTPEVARRLVMRMQFVDSSGRGWPEQPDRDSISPRLLTPIGQLNRWKHRAARADRLEKTSYEIEHGVAGQCRTCLSRRDTVSSSGPDIIVRKSARPCKSITCQAQR